MELDVGVDMRADPGSPTVSTPLTFPHVELFPTCYSPFVSISQAQELFHRYASNQAYQQGEAFACHRWTLGAGLRAL